jgi:Uma2 family endonuclease
VSLAEWPAQTRTMTAEELLLLPEDDIDRELIGGELRERPRTRRNRRHSRSEAKIAKLLGNWLDAQPAPRGEIVSGEAAFLIERDPDTFVGIDVAFASAELVAATDPKSRFFDGPPVFAVEVLSPSDTHGAIVEKVERYLAAGTVVWIVDSDFRTVSVHRRGQVIEVFNETQDLPAIPELPGFRARIAQFFH